MQVLNFSTAEIANFLRLWVIASKLQLCRTARSTDLRTAFRAVSFFLGIGEWEHWEIRPAEIALFCLLFCHVRIVELVWQVLDIQGFLRVWQIEHGVLGGGDGAVRGIFTYRADVRVVQWRRDHRLSLSRARRRNAYWSPTLNHLDLWR